MATMGIIMAEDMEAVMVEVMIIPDTDKVIIKATAAGAVDTVSNFPSR